MLKRSGWDCKLHILLFKVGGTVHSATNKVLVSLGVEYNRVVKLNRKLVTSAASYVQTCYHGH